MKKKIELRPYQQKAIDAINALYPDNKIVLVLATGLGKTICFADIISKRFAETGKKALVVAHREELIFQAKEKIKLVDSKLKIGIEKAELQSKPKDQVIIASVQTIGRDNSERIKKFNPLEFGTIIIDEAHHASASTYKNILSYFGVLKGENKTDWNTELLLLGVTATPSRSDNQGIDEIFDKVGYVYGLVEGIQDNYLSRIKAYRIDTQTSLNDVHTFAGDFNQGELSDSVNNPERNELIVKTYLEHFKKKQALVFAVSIDHAKGLQSAFSAQNVKAEYIDGSTPKDTRKLILRRFHAKQINVLVNCMVLTEGYDNDTIDCIMIARPTQSGILYQQMIGRGTRLHKNKPHLAVVDFVDNFYKHTIKTSASLLGIEADVNFRGRDILDSLQQINEIRELDPSYDLNKLDFNRLSYIMEEVDLLGGLAIPTELESQTSNVWLRFGEDSYRISLGGSSHLLIRRVMTGQYQVLLERWLADIKNLDVSLIGQKETLEDAIKAADAYIQTTDSGVLTNAKAAWRKLPAKDSQINILRKYKIAEGVIAKCDRGKASLLMSKLFSRPKNVTQSGTKSICIAMALDEKKLDSYLLDTFNGQLVLKENSKVVYFPEEKLSHEAWTIQQLKDFCYSTITDKESLKLYKANITSNTNQL